MVSVVQCLISFDAVAASLTVGSILLVAILAKYIQTRRRLHRWTVRFPLSRDLSANEGESEQDLDLNSENKIYDGWLIVRFAIAFVFIETFQILSIFSEIMQLNTNKKEVLPEQPDTSVSRAQVDFIEFIPGVSTGLLVSHAILTFDSLSFGHLCKFETLVKRHIHPC